MTNKVKQYAKTSQEKNTITQSLQKSACCV